MDATGSVQTNALVRGAFDPEDVVDFDDGFGRDLFLPDGVHLNDAGQRLRAQRAREKLSRAGML
jgi:lysophospholipase L1-like esterase